MFIYKVAPKLSDNKVLKQFALNLRLVKESDQCKWQGDSFVKILSEMDEENYLVLLDYEGNWLPF